MKNFFGIFLSAILISSLVSCTKSAALTGSGSSSGTTPASLTGNVNGGLSPVAGALVTLYAMMPGQSAASIGTATTTSSGAYSISYTTPSNSLVFAVATGGSTGSGAANSKTTFVGILGNGSNLPNSLALNEMTTAAAMDLMVEYGLAADSNGTITFSFPGSASSIGNLTAANQNFVTSGAANSGLSNANQTILYTIANGLASCIENASNCATFLSTAQSSSNTAAANLLESISNMMTNTADATPVYNIAFPLGPTTGYNITGSAPSALNVAPIVNSFSYPTGSSPNGIAIDASGNAWISNNGSASIMQISPSGAILQTVTIGTGSHQVAIDQSGNIWVANAGTNNVSEVSPTGGIVGNFTITGNIIGTAIDQFGNIWFGAAFLNTAYKLNASGTVVGTFTLPNSDPRQFAFDTTGNAWVAQASSNVVTELSQSGIKMGTFTAGTGTISLTFDQSGNLWVTNQSSNNITKLSSQGSLLGTFSASSGPGGIGVDASGNVWVSCVGSVRKYNSAGVALSAYSNSTTATFDSALAIDPSGNVWAVSGNNNTVIQIQGAAIGPQFFPYSGPIYP